MYNPPSTTTWSLIEEEWNWGKEFSPLQKVLKDVSSTQQPAKIALCKRKWTRRKEKSKKGSQVQDITYRSKKGWRYYLRGVRRKTFWIWNLKEIIKKEKCEQRLTLFNIHKIWVHFVLLHCWLTAGEEAVGSLSFSEIVSEYGQIAHESTFKWRRSDESWEYVQEDLK